MRSAYFVSVAAAGFATAVLSTATVAAEGDQSDRRVLETVVVTATYRETNLMDTAQSINAIDETLIQELGAQDIGDIFQQIPGLNMTGTTSGASRFSVRGLSSQSPDTSPQSLTLATIGMYLDNTPVTSALGPARQISGNLFDIKRVEVLKGPQGTLFGEGAQGGAIRYLFNQPQTDELELAVNLGLSQMSESDDLSRRMDGMINVPIISDVLAIRAVAFDTETAGYIDNATPFEKDFNPESAQGGRVAVKYTPNDTVGLTGTVYYVDAATEGNSSVFRPYEINLPEFPGRPPQSGDEMFVYNFLAEVDLGWAEFTSSTSYVDRSTQLVTSQSSDATGVLEFFAALSAFQANPFNPDPIPLDRMNMAASVSDLTTDVERFSQEFRLVSAADDRLRWTAGLFYKDSTDNIAAGTFFTPNPGRERFTGPINEFFLSPANIHEDTLTEYAAFGEVSYDITETFEITGGLRVSRLEQDIGNVEVSTTDTPVSPKLVLSWRPAEELLTYFSYTTGFRPGNANQAMKFYLDQFTTIRDLALANGDAVRAAQAQHEVDRSQANLTFTGDEVTSYELGLKTTFWEGRARLSGAVYYSDWEDMIQKYQDAPVFTGGGFGPNRNAGSATAKGIELELTTLLTDRLTLRLAGDVNEAQLGETSSAGEKGNDLVNAPGHSLAVMLDYAVPVTDRLEATFHIDQSWVAEQYSDSNNSPFLLLPSYHKTNARITLRDASQDKWRVVLYGKNLFNEEILRSIMPNPFNPTSPQFFYETPRQIGVEFAWRM